jgi:ABC-type transport system involved in multi-copper enzyme maturation permease subunit
MKKGRPLLEIFASAVHEDYRFPILEIFAFLFALGAFVSVGTTSMLSSSELLIYALISASMGTPLLVFLLLIFKNIAYGLGGDIEKGTIQMYLTYPLKRRNILTAKLLSAIGVSSLLFFGIQVFTLTVKAPLMILPNISTVLLTYLANFGNVLLLTSITLLITLFIKRGVAALVIGVVMYFAIQIAIGIVSFFASASSSTILFQVVSLLNPSLALQAHYAFPTRIIEWSPSLLETAYYVIANYAIAAFLFLICYYYFSRRMSI